MRIEINSGGLSTGCTLGVLHDNLEHSIDHTERLLNSLRQVRSYTYTINGGVGALQPALDDINRSIFREEIHLSNMKAADAAVEHFVQYTHRVDRQVAVRVTRNRNLFYRVNPWARPHPSRPGFTLPNLHGPLFGRLMPYLPNGPARILPVPGLFGLGLGIGAGALRLAGKAASAGGMQFGYQNGWFSANGSFNGATTTYDGNKTTKSLFSGDVNGEFGKNGTGVGFGATFSGPKATWGDGKASASVGSFGLNGKATIAGNEIGSVKADVDLLGASAQGKVGLSVKADENGKTKSVFLGAGGEAEAHVMKGELETKSFGLFTDKAKLSVGNASAEGKVGITLMDGGKFAPGIGANASAKANVAEGSVTQQFGTDNYNLYNTASGKVLGAEAKASAGVGMVSYKDSTSGQTKTGFGVSAEAGAEAYIAQGTVKSGFTIAGIKFDGGITGKYGAVGAKAGGHVTTSDIGGSVDLGLGLGLGVNFNVDFSGFKPVDPIKEVRESVPFVDSALDFFGF